MYGPVLYDAFCTLKKTFDPKNIFNPGKIVHAPPITANLRFGSDYETREYNTVFDFSDFGDIIRSAEQCSGVGEYRKNLTGTLCPSYMATRNETDVTRGRANTVAFFLDTFSNYYEPEHLQNATQTAHKFGWNILVPERVCCGRPLISKGFLDEAMPQAEKVVRSLVQIAEKSIPIVFCEPGCYSARL